MSWLKMSFIFACLVLILMPPTWSLAQLDCSGDNLLAVIFDNGDNNIEAPAYVGVPAHVVVLNPTTSDIWGYEFGFHIDGNYIAPSIALAGSGPIDVGLGLGNHIVGLNGPIPTSEVTTLATLSFLPMDTNPILIYLQLVEPQSSSGFNSVVIPPGDELLHVFPVSEDYSLPVAAVNPDFPLEYCPVQEEYELAITIASGGDNNNFAATSLNATDGYDADMDFIDSDPNRKVYFPHTGWVSSGEDHFRTDVQSVFDPLNEIKQWTFVVDTPYLQSPAQEVRIDFGPNFSESWGYQLQLVDQYTGQTTSLWPNLSYVYEIYANDSRTFELQVASFQEDFDFSVGISYGGDSDNTAAVSMNATDGYDPLYDFPDDDPYRKVYFPRTGWTSPFENYFKTDVRAPFNPLTEMKQWTFVVDTPVVQSDGETVQIAFDPSFVESSGNALRLVDHTTGVTVSLWPNCSYSYPMYNAGSRTFDLQIGSSPVLNDPFTVEFGVYCGEMGDTGNFAGTHPDAQDGYDPGLDIPEPAPAPAVYLAASFTHPEWPIGSRYTTDYRSLFDPLTESRVWAFQVETDQNANINMDFTPSFSELDGISLKLKDLSNGQEFNLYPSQTYSYLNTGPSIRQFELTVGGEGPLPPDLEPASRNISDGWSLIGLPLVPLAGSNTLGDVILDQVPGYGYVYDYPSTDGYRFLSAGDPAQYGVGYWLATDAPFNWTMLGGQYLDGITIDLNPGWNLLGNPMWFPCPVDGIMVNYEGQTYDWDSANNIGLVAPLQDYDRVTDSYYQTFDMVAWQGYWFRSYYPGISLTFHYPNFQIVPNRLIASFLKEDDDTISWSTEFQVTVPGEKVARSVTLGAHSTATEGFDPRLDWPEPPASPLGGSRLAVQHPEWDLPGGNSFVTDMVHPDQEIMTWNIALTTGYSGDLVFSWDRSQWPSDLDFQLYIPEKNRVVVMSMAKQESIVLPVSGGSLTVQVRTPDMTSGVEDTPAPPWRLGLYPNPFNPITTLSFDLNRPCTAEIRIYSVRGELVKTLAQDQYMAGSHQISWRGTDEKGRSVPSGAYFARLLADGDQVGEVIKMSLIR
ncbi:MAG: hypothetical protein KOO63_12100 [Bacteroidales bacterium]|nr:hypothetical protein [Candidatus Latescibacterota bacterium]